MEMKLAMLRETVQRVMDGGSVLRAGVMGDLQVERFQETVNALYIPNVVRFECHLTRWQFQLPRELSLRYI